LYLAKRPDEMYLYIETIETCTRLLKLRPFLITGNGMLLKYVKGATRARFHQWMRGPMARRLTTNQEILGSIPSVFIFVLSRHGVRLLLLVCVDYLLVVALKENFLVAWKEHRHRSRLFLPPKFSPSIKARHDATTKPRSLCMRMVYKQLEVFVLLTCTKKMFMFP
jgi:hypothetical protein